MVYQAMKEIRRATWVYAVENEALNWVRKGKYGPKSSESVQMP